MDKREELIKPYIIGKDVLDLGVGDINDRFLHKFVKLYSKSVVGVEIDKQRVTEIRRLGFKVVKANAEKLCLNKKFDVIIAGDLIEHLYNQGLFLECVKKHLRKDGLLILNSPNAYSINNLLRGLVLKEVKQFDEHTTLYTEQLLKKILNNYGFGIERVIYYNYKNKDLLNMVVRFLSMFRNSWKENIMIIVKLED